MRLRSYLSLVLATAIALTGSGCTVLGLGVGAVTPRYEKTPEGHQFRPGERVAVRASPRGEQKGRVVRQTATEVVISFERYEEEPIDRAFDLREATAIEVQRGTYAGTGAAIGLAIDLVAIAATAVVLRNVLDFGNESDQ